MLSPSLGLEMHLGACQDKNIKIWNNIITTAHEFCKIHHPGCQMLMSAAFALEVGICWLHKLDRKNESTPIYTTSLKSQNCTHHKELHKGKVNLLPTDATIPSRNKINFITT